jgi:hypothetical protein
MHSRLRSSSILVWSIVSSVLPVSGFAQTDSRAQAMLVRTSETAVRPYSEDPDLANDVTTLPRNLIVDSVLRPVVEAMRAGSPTFRRQCARIASAPQLLVEIASDPPLTVQRSAALTRITRHELGRIRATVRVALSRRAPELIAHEIEHVIEQLDGIDLAVQARRASSGVHVCKCGEEPSFETRRAIATGLRVARELSAD